MSQIDQNRGKTVPDDILAKQREKIENDQYLQAGSGKALADAIFNVGVGMNRIKREVADA